MGSHRHADKQSFPYVLVSVLVHAGILASIVFINKDSLFSSIAKHDNYTEVNFEAATPPAPPIKKIKKQKTSTVKIKKIVKKKPIKRSVKKRAQALPTKLPAKKAVVKPTPIQEEAPVAVVVAKRPKPTPVVEKKTSAPVESISEPIDVEEEVEEAAEDFADPYDEVSDQDDTPLEEEQKPTNIQAARPILPTKGRGSPFAKGKKTTGFSESKGPFRDYRLLRQRPGNAPPIYPSYARQTGAEGTVVLTYNVSSKGNVRNIRISRSSGNRYLDTEAVRAVRRFRYFPGQEGKTIHPINFKLKGQARFKSPIRSS